MASTAIGADGEGFFARYFHGLLMHTTVLVFVQLPDASVRIVLHFPDGVTVTSHFECCAKSVDEIVHGLWFLVEISQHNVREPTVFHVHDIEYLAATLFQISGVRTGRSRKQAPRQALPIPQINVGNVVFDSEIGT